MMSVHRIEGVFRQNRARIDAARPFQQIGDSADHDHAAESRTGIDELSDFDAVFGPLISSHPVRNQIAFAVHSRVVHSHRQEDVLPQVIVERFAAHLLDRGAQQVIAAGGVLELRAWFGFDRIFADALDYLFWRDIFRAEARAYRFAAS